MRFDLSDNRPELTPVFLILHHLHDTDMPMFRDDLGTKLAFCPTISVDRLTVILLRSFMEAHVPAVCIQVYPNKHVPWYSSIRTELQRAKVER